VTKQVNWGESPEIPAQGSICVTGVPGPLSLQTVLRFAVLRVISVLRMGNTFLRALRPEEMMELKVAFAKVPHRELKSDGSRLCSRLHLYPARNKPLRTALRPRPATNIHVSWASLSSPVQPLGKGGPGNHAVEGVNLD